MPIFQDPERFFPQVAKLSETVLLKSLKSKVSKKSVRTEFCDGPLSDAPPWATVGNEDVGYKDEGRGCGQNGVCTSDRNELIERIKRGESPTWIPSQTGSILAAHSWFQSLVEFCVVDDASYSRHSYPKLAGDLLIPMDADDQEYATELSPPSEIKRPRSALHAGDFNRGHHDGPTASQNSSSAFARIGTSPVTSWYGSDQRSQGFSAPHRSAPISLRSRAPSLNSHSSSFVAKAPTTPLIQQLNNTDLDFSPTNQSTSPSKSSRRHTLPPRPLQVRQSSPSSEGSSFAAAAHQMLSLHRETTSPSKTHRPRRSLTTAYSLQISPSPQRSNFLRGRRQSLSSEASPLHNASMVGSYEESILRGWMSTAPSKPLDFTAQIGVLGKTNCKPKCPAHVIIPFPAVFYSWSAGTGRMPPRVEDDPSPYVGHIDLQQLPTPAESKRSRRSRSKSPVYVTSSITVQDTADTKSRNEADTTNKRNNKKRRRASPAPLYLQGGYRIPQKGQLQIVIKNPNKTAVKLFLVPYDLESMEAGTKTFIRQRCYSTDPVIEGMPSKSMSEPKLPSPGNVVKSKPTLRYLIHLNICSPSTGRFYLYQHIRVVFANRVPDNKEQLQTEIQVPQPRYSAYNPNVAPSRSVSSSGAASTKKNVYSRRSSGFGVGHEAMDDHHPQTFGNGSSSSLLFDSHLSTTPPVPRIPFPMIEVRGVDLTPKGLIYSAYKTRDGPFADAGQAMPLPAFGGPEADATPAPSFHRLAVVEHRPRATEPENRRPAEVEATDVNRPIPPFGKTSLRHRGRSSASDVDNSIYRSLPSDTINNPKRPACHDGNGTYSKLSKGDAGYGGRPSTPELGEGLLAKKLKRLEVQKGVGEEDGDTKVR
ncbi:MAG: hypothetical protein Q9184_005999 [Pyrenodesmia sp. 2 TL-2023]